MNVDRPGGPDLSPPSLSLLLCLKVAGGIC